MIKDFTTVRRAGLLLSFLLLVSTLSVQASHLRAGEITVERPNRLSRTLIITITVYTNTASTVVFGGDGLLYFGDGSEPFEVPEIESTPRPDLGPNVGIAVFVKEHPYPTIGAYTISYMEPNRNGGVLNMNNSFFTTFYLETKFDMSVTGGNYSPKLEIAPIDEACSGVAFFHNPGAYDLDVIDSLSYELVRPFRDRGQEVINYRDPNLVEFYRGIPFSNEDGSGPPTFSMDPVNGTLLWDAPGLQGEYNIAFHVVEWRKIAGIWTQIGYVRRDMQIIVNQDCTNERPLMDVPQDTCVVAGASIQEFVYPSDPNNDLVRIEAFSQVFSLPSSPATYSPVLNYNEFRDPASYFLTFNWNTNCTHIKGQPYQVVFKITDNGAPKLVTQDTWQITVVAPAPVLNTATPVVPQRHVQLQWSPYECSVTNEPDARIQVWRRVGETSYTSPDCVTGMPESLGFSLVTTLPITSVNFTDTNSGRGLDRGVQYCYRLVAIFPSRGAESYVSNEQCIPPMENAGPLVTEVSVLQTSEDLGGIRVSWIPPLDPNPSHDPDDYEYQLERADGSDFIAVSGRITGTTASDGSLNTWDQQYAYRVMLYLQGDTDPVDSSAIASSVRLDLATRNKEIDLSWSATVPWSNQVENRKHYIYMKQVETENYTLLSELDLIDSVDVIVDGLRYTRTGLDSTRTYCFAVKTVGSYGYPGPDGNLDSLVNVSQINCAKPTVTEPPCKPKIAAFGNPCENYLNGEYSCDANLFRHEIRWSMTNACEQDIRGYYLYTVANTAQTYEIVQDAEGNPILFRDTVAILENRQFLASCYRVQAVNRSGAKSELSDPVCLENCPNYILPNVFSPNGDNCNDLFRAYGVPIDIPDTPIGDCTRNMDGVVNGIDTRCARFVQRVDFKVFNRWGRHVYSFTGERGTENSIYLNWDGRDKTGKELATGIYYYAADVTFDSTRPGGTKKTLKGWIHLVR